jgi:hypothetical protein
MIISILSIVAPTYSLSADAWILKESQSRISFITIKQDDIAEVHTFKKIAGSVNEKGTANLSIDLDSVETNIDIRNERMRKFLFETASNSSVSISTDLNIETFNTLNAGERILLEDLTFEISLHGISAALSSNMYVTRINADKVLVETATPVLVHADDFNLGKGILKLRELAGLDSITPVVPVSASLLFTK